MFNLLAKYFRNADFHGIMNTGRKEDALGAFYAPNNAMITAKYFCHAPPTRMANFVSMFFALAQTLKARTVWRPVMGEPDEISDRD